MESEFEDDFLGIYFVAKSNYSNMIFVIILWIRRLHKILNLSKLYLQASAY